MPAETLIRPDLESPKIQYDEFLAIDTEGTGLDMAHGCRAFAVSACNQDGETWYFEGKVNPRTRGITWATSTIRKISQLMRKYKVYFMHNAPFDVQMLSLINGSIKKILTNKTIHDTRILAHIYDSKGPGGLKDLALLHLDIDDSDEAELDGVVKRLQRKMKDRWDIARKEHPQSPGAKSKFHKMDMWLPKAYANSKYFEGNEEYRELLNSVCETYAVLDAVRTAGLAHLLSEYVNADPECLQAYNLQLGVLKPVIEMEQNGIHLLEESFERELQEYTVQAQGFRKSMQTMVDDPEFNPDSYNDVNQALYQRFKYPTKDIKEGTKGLSTDKDTLNLLLSRRKSVTFQAHRFTDTLLHYRAVNSAVKYLQSYQRFHANYYLHPNIRICGTSTTRISTSEPNGQNVSKGKENELILDEQGNPIIEYSLRRVFGPRNGKKWYAIDYDQLQIRIFAYLSGEPSLIRAIERGFDFHTTVAQSLFGVADPTKAQRKTAKYINFGIIFGAGEKRITELSGDPTAYKRFTKLYPNVADYIARTIQEVRSNGYVRTASGYPLTVQRNKAYAGVNYKVQGTEGDIVKLALARISNYFQETGLEDDVKFILQVHDEIIFECDQDFDFPVSDICNIMDECGDTFGVLCKSKPELITTNWGEAEKIDLALAL